MTYTNQGLQAAGLDPDEAALTEFFLTASAGTVASRAGVLRPGRVSVGDASYMLRSRVEQRLVELRALPGGSNNRLGQAISAAMDLRTGRISAVYVNGESGALPIDLHPTLRNRLPAADALPYQGSAAAGSHSEIYAVSELLNQGASMDDIVVWTRQIGTRREGTMKPACPHCQVLLDGVTYVR